MIDRHEHLDEGTIHAWLDGALPPDESARVESAAGSCAECAALVAEARGLIAASSRILSSLDAVPAGVIPGTSANVDQLAALRARQRARSRRWWQDRRVAVAASLVVVAGVSSLVLRSSGNSSVDSSAPQVLESVATPTAPPPAAAPAPAPTADVSATTAAPSTRQAPSQQAKVAASPAPSTARDRVAVTAVDSAVSRKVAPPSAPIAGAVANEVRRADTGIIARLADSMARSRDVAAPERQLRQEGTRQTVQQFRVDSIQRAATPSALGLQRRAVAPSAVGAAMAEVAPPGGTCYRLRGLTAPAITDTVRLLNQQAPVLNDPAWFRTQIYGALRDTTLAWRSIDAVTVELRSRFGSDTSAVQFRTDGAVLENRETPRVRNAPATRVACPN